MARNKFKKGFELLEGGHYKDAHAYFVKRTRMESSKAPINLNHYNTCLYGQARSFIGLEEYTQAETILKDLITKNPTWTAPYVTYARMLEQVKAPVAAAETFQTAFSHADPDKRLNQHYQWFLENHVAPMTPAFQLGSQQLSSVGESSEFALEGAMRQLKMTPQSASIWCQC